MRLPSPLLRIGLLVLLAALAALPARAQESLSVAEVQQVIAQAVVEAQARNRSATIAVVDRVGNVLGVFAMTGAPATVTVTSNRGVTGGLEGAAVPTSTAAIAKAVTGAYLSSGGNAFTTRTANQIIQEAFNPGESGQPSGPLFGVQFSQLPCSDFSLRNQAGVNQFIGPKRSPLGLSADPGGLPLYKNNVPVGGIGVLSDGIYGLDLNIADIDSDDDELIAVAGTVGFEPPVDIKANRITVDGKSLRYTDMGTEALKSNPEGATFAAVNGVAGALQMVTGYNDAAAIVGGTAYGTAASGVRADGGATYPASLDAFIFVDGNNNNRFAPRAGTDGGMTAAEVTDLVTQALTIANRGRAQIRRPLNSPINVTVSVVDSNGAILAMARTNDGPIFGSDVSLQKARTAAFFSNPNAGAELIAGGQAVYVTAARDLLGPTALADGIAFADRSGGNLSRPFFPDGSRANQNGPFSLPFGEWSPFKVGLQLDLIAAQVVAHLNFVAGTAGADIAANCTTLPVTLATGAPRIPNGIQIFPGSVPIYKNGFLVGGIGVSGDGIDQDDMISFLGLHNAGVSQASGIGNAPKSIRADTLTPEGIRLRYVSCPFTPFVGSSEQSPCAGK